MLRWITFIFTILAGIAVGLFYGWVVNPVRYVDASLADLQDDFKSDYVWMVAEAYQVEHNPDLAAQRLALLGADSPAEAVHQALLVAMQARPRFNDTDLQKIRDLESSMRAWKPILRNEIQPEATP